MSTFYVLPTRPQLGQRFASFLATWFPGLDWQRAALPELADALIATVADHRDVFIVHRDDLPDGEELARALVDGFGAEEGDEVVELLPAKSAGEVTARRWRLPTRSAA
jgi:hypothetical protein